nr:hypothetical protein [Hymenobacter elongatus]
MDQQPGNGHGRHGQANGQLQLGLAQRVYRTEQQHRQQAAQRGHYHKDEGEQPAGIFPPGRVTDMADIGRGNGRPDQQQRGEPEGTQAATTRAAGGIAAESSPQAAAPSPSASPRRVRAESWPVRWIRRKTTDDIGSS